MARMVRPTRVREGTSFGERGSEIVVFIIIVIALIFAARWYFVIYRNSPTVALMSYIGAVKAGDVDTQYGLVSANTKKFYADKDTYVDKWKMARGLHGRMVDFTITKIEQSGDKANADVSVAVRKASQDILHVEGSNVLDHYVLVKETDGWKIALDECAKTIKTLEFAEDR